MSQLPSVLADGTTVVDGGTLTTVDGVKHSVKLDGTQTAIFTLIVPSSSFTITTVQDNDVVNNTPVKAVLSQTPGDLRSTLPHSRKDHSLDGPSDHVQFMSGDTQGGATSLHCNVNGGNTVELHGGSPKAINMKAGDVWYLMYQFRDSAGKSTLGGKHGAAAHGNLSVKLQ